MKSSRHICLILTKLEISRYVFGKPPIQNITKICPADVVLYYVDERAAMMKTVNFRNSANAPTVSLVRSFITSLRCCALSTESRAGCRAFPVR